MSEMTDPEYVDFGPLAGLIGTWKGDKGIDVAPEPDGAEENSYYETLMFEPVGDVTNAERQTLMAIRYLQAVHRNTDNKLIHNETGYWMWDAEAETIIQSLAIPRGVCEIPGGKATRIGNSGDALSLDVIAQDGDPDWSIIQAPFMRDHARTLEFRHHVRLDGDILSYSETTVIKIYGRTFDHTDENELSRC